MATLNLVRITSSSQYGTFGALSIDNVPQCVTLEPFWRDNEFENSCIPTGTYDLEWFNSPSYGRTLRLVEVPGRTDILFHYGNTQKKTLGCILVGKQYGQISCKQAILHSRNALNSILFKLENEEKITLKISEAY